MKGHIRQRSKGSWTIVIDVGRDPQTGRRRQQWHTVRGTKRDAQRVLREMLLSLEKSMYVKPTRLTVAEWLRQWFDGYVVMHTTSRTQESYQSIISRHLIPALGAIPLLQLQPQHLQSYYARALADGRVDGKGGLSARSVLYQHRILSEALSHAVKMGVAPRNVAEVVNPPHPGRPKMATLTLEDVPQFLDHARETPYYVLYCTLLYSGLRRGEALALRWRYVDLDTGVLRVVETLYKLGDGTCVVKEPKTPHSRRAIALPPSLTLLLRQYLDHHKVLCVLQGRRFSEDDFVFERPDGKPLDPNAVTRTFSKLVRRAGLPHLRLHDLRHTHATFMLTAGVHPKVVSERLGHANIAVTLDTYSHVLPGLQEAAADRFDRLLERSPYEENEGADVSKMFAEDFETGSRPWWIRTTDTLIKSQGVSKQIGKEVRMAVLTP